MGPLRRLAVLVALLGIALGAGLFLAPGAAAGGPTSVLIVSPESGAATGLYASSADYGRLSALLDARARAAGAADPPPGLDAVTGMRRINVTWLLHDVTPWRLDRVHASDDGRTAWIHTAKGLPESYDGVWHRAAAPAELTALLRKLGVMGEKGGGARAVAVPPGPPRDGDGTTAAAPQGVEARPGGPGGWWWAAPGVAVGVVLGALLRPVAARWARRVGRGRSGARDTGPRRQLLDL
ncbi:hypothetical protein RB196_04325 [Streptomyces sp. PmtA]|uniref:hypothetical protein n=1 Tax=Streptomyces sp. PmtA TaxID=3074275 RepID=UPI0030145393